MDAAAGQGEGTMRAFGKASRHDPEGVVEAGAVILPGNRLGQFHHLPGVEVLLQPGEQVVAHPTGVRVIAITGLPHFGHSKVRPAALSGPRSLAPQDTPTTVSGMMSSPEKGIGAASAPAPKLIT